VRLTPKEFLDEKYGMKANTHTNFSLSREELNKLLDEYYVEKSRAPLLPEFIPRMGLRILGAPFFLFLIMITIAYWVLLLSFNYIRYGADSVIFSKNMNRHTLTNLHEKLNERL